MCVGVVCVWDGVGVWVCGCVCVGGGQSAEVISRVNVTTRPSQEYPECALAASQNVAFSTGGGSTAGW